MSGRSAAYTSAQNAQFAFRSAGWVHAGTRAKKFVKPPAKNTDAQMDARAGAKPIPLPLTPMVLPYMRQARVAFRIERVPQTARLSRGRKNDDHSWSLSDTEIKDVAYVPPRDGAIPPTLAIRVVRVDSGDTLGVIEVQMPEEPRRQAAAGRG